MKANILQSSCSIQFKLACATHFLNSISPNDAKVSFKKTGLWPMDMRFVDCFPSIDDSSATEQHSSPTANRSTQQPDTAVIKRTSGETLKGKGKSTDTLQSISDIIRNSASISSVVYESMHEAKPSRRKRKRKPFLSFQSAQSKSIPPKQPKREVIAGNQAPDGAPARYLTLK